MPHAAPIPALPAPVSPTLLQQGGAYNKAAVSTHAFGEMFREQAGSIQDSAPKATSAAEKSSAGSDSPMSVQKTEASSITEQAITDQPESASGSAVLPGASQTQLLNQSHGAANSQVNAVMTLAEASEASLSAPTAESPTSLPTKSPTDSKDTNPSSSAQAVHLQHKTKEASQAGKPGAESAPPPVATPPAQFVLPVTGSSAPPPAMQPVTASSAADQTSTALDGNRTTNAANTQRPAGEKAAEADSSAPPQSASTEGHPAASAAPGTPQTAGTQAASSVPGGVSQPAAHGSADDGASSKESSSDALPSALAPHSSRAAAEQPASAATGTVASSPTPAEAHSTDAGNSSSSLPRLEQPAAAATPAASPATTAASNLYDKIDQGTAPVVLHSGAQQVAVGVHDPGLGWVEIKTQNMAGHVVATLVTASGQTHASLAAQLPAMAQYLEQRDVRVGTLAVHHQMPGANTGGQSGGYGNGGAGAQHPNHSNSNSEGLAARYTSVSPGFLQPGVEEAGSSLRPLSYISVRA